MSDQTTAIQGELVTINNAAPSIGDEIAGITSDKGNVFYSSLVGGDFETQLKMADAEANAVSLSENLNKAIEVEHIIVEEVTLNNVDEKTGEVTGTSQAPRTTLIAADGSTYSATSVGVFSSVRQMIKRLGEPANWPHPVTVHFVEQGVKPRRYMTMRYGAPASK